jgi:sugar phosphate isomerase/epimerase
MLNRRHFLKSSTVALGTTVVPISLKGRRQNTCTLGFSTYGMKELKTPQALAVLEEIGYDSVELTIKNGWHADPAKLDKKKRIELQKRLADSPLRLTSFMEHVAPTDAKKQTYALNRLKLATEMAHDLAPKCPPLIQSTLGNGKFADMRKSLRDRLGEWLQIADATGTTIAIKPHRGSVVSRPSEAIWLLDQLGNPSRLRMVFDYSHYIFRELSMGDTIRTSLPYTAHIAVKDAVKVNGRVAFKLPGETGTIDFPALIRLFYAGGYDGDFNCEVSGMVWNNKGYDPVVAAKTCYHNMNKALLQAGVR